MIGQQVGARIPQATIGKNASMVSKQRRQAARTTNVVGVDGRNPLGKQVPRDHKKNERVFQEEKLHIRTKMVSDEMS